MAARWLADGATNLGSTASWSATRGGATGASVPTAGDDVHIWTGTQTINTDLDVDLESVTVYAGFKGNIGTPGSPVTIGCHNSADALFKVEAGSASNIYLTAGTAGIEQLEVRMGGGEFRLSGGTTDDARLYSGRVYIESGAVVTNLYNFGAQVVTATNATGHTLLYHSGGTMEITDRDIATGYIDGGNTRLVLKGDSAVTTGLNVTGGAYYNHQSDGTVAILNLSESFFTVANAPAAPTISSLVLLSKKAQAVTTAGSITATVSSLTSNGFSTISQPDIPNGFE